jgi:rare lipoprotein A
MMKRIPALSLFSLIGLVALAAQTQEGRGTWYETDSKGLSASHSNLPFGTRVRVTNLQNNKQVIVTINNRIAETPDRLIDVSKAAAENIGMSPRDATPVRIEVISRRAAAQPESPPASPAAEASPPASPAAEAPPPPSPPAVQTPPPASPAVQTPPPAGGGGALPAQGGQNPLNPSGIVNQAIVTINGVPGSPSPAAAGPALAEPVPGTARPPVPGRAPGPAAPLSSGGRAAGPSSRGLYRIQIGAFLDERNAAAAFDRLRAAGFSPVYERYDRYYRVVLTGIGAADVEGVALRLEAAGFQEVLIREEL